MIKKIFKYELNRGSYNPLELPKGAEFRFVGIREGSICLWFEVNPDEPIKERREFRIFGTGWDIVDRVKLEYLGSVLEGTEYVWHIYERKFANRENT